MFIFLLVLFGCVYCSMSITFPFYLVDSSSFFLLFLFSFLCYPIYCILFHSIAYYTLQSSSFFSFLATNSYYYNHLPYIRAIYFNIFQFLLLLLLFETSREFFFWPNFLTINGTKFCLLSMNIITFTLTFGTYSSSTGVETQ